MTSKCAKSDSAEYIQKAVETGFAGMVFTNHFFRGNTAIDRDIPWKDFVEYYKKDWYNAKVEGDKADIDVIFGLEEGYGKGKECLIYGLTPELIAGCADFSKLPIKELSAFVRENGGMIFCAHPFRQRGYITDPSDEPDMTLFDGIEVYNRGNTDEDNLTAEIFAKNFSTKERFLCFTFFFLHYLLRFVLSSIKSIPVALVPRIQTFFLMPLASQLPL